MAKPRLKPSGKWELTVSHPSLPRGRKAYSFDTEEDALIYAERWRLMKLQGLPPPAEMLKSTVSTNVILAQILRAWINSGKAAPSSHSALGSLVMEVGSVRLVDADYDWLEGYVQDLKVKTNLAPGSIRHRVQGLSIAIDEYLRKNRHLVFANPVKMLPKGYSTYNEIDKKLAIANGATVKVDVSRDRRLLAGEEEKIIAALSGHQRPDRERALELLGGNALLTMFKLIANTGLRLKEAYTLKAGGIDLAGKVITAQCSKQWRGKIVFRNVPMSPAAHAALETYLATREFAANDYLFPFMEEEADLPIKKVSARLSARFKTAFQYADCHGLKEHDLRHEATCRWFEMKDAKGNWLYRLEEINKIMGWSANSVMAQRYASFRSEDLAARMWAIPEAADAVVTQ